MDARADLRQTGNQRPVSDLYYEIVASIMLPFLKGRLLNLFRCRQGRCFFQRNREHPPTGTEFDHLVHFKPVKQKNGRTEDYLYVERETEIVACAKAQTVEFHGWGSRAEKVETPDRMVIDLDPGTGLKFSEVKAAAFEVQNSFAKIGLQSFALLSGGKGIHVVVPIVPRASWNEVREFTKIFCVTLVEAHPRRFTIALPKKERSGRIFLDFLRNQRTATAVQPYSVRARKGMPVAMPVSWDELEGVSSSDEFTIADIETILQRSQRSDLKSWAMADQQLPEWK